MERSAEVAHARWPAPWVFALLALINGVFQSYLITPFPYMLRQKGYAVDSIASMVAFVLLPMTLYFLWSPIVDIGLSRRVWIPLLSAVSGFMLFAAILLLPRHAAVAEWLLFGGYGVSLMTNSAAGGLLALTQHGENKGTAAAWMQGGGLAATALGGAALLYCSKNLPDFATALVAAVLVAAPACIALSIREIDAPEKAGSLREMSVAMGREIKETLFSWRCVPGVLLLIAPVGSGSAQSLFVAMAGDYHVGARGVMWLDGLLGGVLTMLGALAAVVLPARWDRRLAYAGAGLVCACTGSFLALAPMTPVVYFVGVGLYLLSVGLCYAFFLGVVMCTMGEAKRSASTRFTLLVSLGNLPIVYMTRVEGWGYHRFGPHGVPALDAAGNLLVAGLVAVWLGIRLLKPRRPTRVGLAALASTE